LAPRLVVPLGHAVGPIAAAGALIMVLRSDRATSAPSSTTWLLTDPSSEEIFTVHMPFVDF
jgi:hypothetical protein